MNPNLLRTRTRVTPPRPECKINSLCRSYSSLSNQQARQKYQSKAENTDQIRLQLFQYERKQSCEMLTFCEEHFVRLGRSGACFPWLCSLFSVPYLTISKQKTLQEFCGDWSSDSEHRPRFIECKGKTWTVGKLWEMGGTHFCSNQILPVRRKIIRDWEIWCGSHWIKV